MPHFTSGSPSLSHLEFRLVSQPEHIQGIAVCLMVIIAQAAGELCEPHVTFSVHGLRLLEQFRRIERRKKFRTTEFGSSILNHTRVDAGIF